MYSKIVSSILGKTRPKDKNNSVLKSKKGCDAAISGPAPEAAGHAHCEHCGRSEDPDDDAMTQRDYLVFRWNVKYLGSFPISNTSADHVGYRLEKFSAPNVKPASISVSSLGVRVHGETELLLSHSLRRVCSVVARPSIKEVAYIALEPTGQTYRKQCHVFRTQEIQHVEEIEAVLGNAFQAAATRARLAGSSVSSASSAAMATSTPVQPMGEKRASSSAFLSRLMGRTKEPEDPHKSAKRKRRPVSAVFSAFQRFSSSATVTTQNKRMTSYEPLMREPSTARVAPAASPVPEEPIPSSRLSKASSDTTPPSLIYDENLGEHIYPVDDTLQAQLEHVNYFVRLPTREHLVCNLLKHPDGAFVVRYSESKRRCLALSVKVPPEHNASCISHYLIIRNEAGYRIKGFLKSFPSLQMLVTHHSVLPEQLPVPLYFVQWNKQDWQMNDRRQSRLLNDENRVPEWNPTPRRRPVSHTLEDIRVAETA